MIGGRWNAAGDAIAVEATPEGGGKVLRVSGSTIAWLLLASAGAVWAVDRILAVGTAPMAGGMPVSAGLFVVYWSLMMAAMMLPVMTPVARLYLALGEPAARTRDRAARAAGLVGGYIVSWALVGVAAFLVVRGSTRLVDAEPGVAHVAAAATIAGCGLYQLSPWKDRCLAHCRSPLGAVIHGAGLHGPFRHLRAGADHAAWCIGCCWTLMLALVVLGAMEIGWMAAFVAVLVLEKTWRHGRLVAIAAGIALIVLGGAVLVDASLAGILETGGMEGM